MAAQYVIESNDGDGRWRAVATEVKVNGRWHTVTRWSDKRLAQNKVRELERANRATLYRVRRA